ncbi:MAG TPA: PEGA domain-containing protein [Burkholderiales bacterium]|nr:PEGA domain-containing protein [Burkholderiales bacterium]
MVCSVLFLDIVEYSKKPVSEQLKVKEQFNARVSDAMRDIAVGDRIILDTGDGVAVNFLGDPEDALLVAMNLSQALASTPEREAEVEVRTGVNLGPVRLVRDVSGQPTIIGDGINVAERVMSFARPGQVLVSRSYYETVTRSAEDYARLFAYQGSRTDKHVREHEIYEVAAPASDALDLAQRRHRARPAKRATPIDLAESKVGTSRAAAQKWLGDRALAYGAAVLSVTALAAALVSYVSEPGDTSPAKPAKPSVPKQVELPEPPPPVVVTASPPEVAVAPPQVVAAAPPAPPAASEPVKPSRRGAGQRDSGTRKPSRAAPKARKPTSHALDAPPVHAEAKTAPALPAKAPVAEEPAPASTHTNAKGIAGPTALIMLAVSPWGEVVVDGKSVGVAPPLSELELAPGRYRIEIRNGAFKPYLETFDLEPNQTIRIKYKFKEG